MTSVADSPVGAERSSAGANDVADRRLAYRKVPSYTCNVPRRKPGALLPLEVEILQVALSMQRAGDPLFHGFRLAQSMGEGAGGRLIGHGTVYKALGRLEEMGLLSSRWEQDPPDGRPRRRLYELTATGTKVALTARIETTDPAVSRRLSPGTA